MVIGALAAWAKLSGGFALRTAADAYTTVLRGVPDLLVIYLFYFGSSSLLTSMAALFGRGGFFALPGFVAGSMAIGVISGAQSTEVFRGAFLAVRPGEIEAARACGMGRSLRFRRIVAPLTLRHALPGMGNIWLGLLKESSLLSATGVAELMRQAQVGVGVDAPAVRLLHRCGAPLHRDCDRLRPRRRGSRAPLLARRPEDVMDRGFLLDTLGRLVAGIPLTLELAALSVVAGACLGLLIALLRLSGRQPLVGFAWLYVQLVRSTPLLVLMFLIYYGLSQFAAIRTGPFWPILREPYWCALIALSFNSAAYAAEIIRGGLLSVGRNERDAALACGMSRMLLFRRIVLPMAIRQALPAYGNELIAMVKATSLASLVTLMEVTGIAASIASESYRPIGVFVAAGAIYLAITFLLTRGVMALEYWLTPHLRPPPVAAARPEGVAA